MKTVLIIPPWYPTPEDPISGSFFKEQALALMEYYNIIVLRVINEKRLLFNFLRKYNVLTVVTDEMPVITLRRRTPFFSLPKYVIDKFEKRVFFDKAIAYHNKKHERWNKKTALYVEKFLISEFSRPDFIYSLSISSNLQFSVSFAEHLGVPVAISEHTPYPVNGSISTRNDKVCIEKADCFLAISNHVARMVLMQNIDIYPNYIGNMVDESKFPLKSLKPHKTKNILIVGAYSFYKDYDSFFRSIQLLLTIVSVPFTVTIVGYASLKGYSEKQEKFEHHLSSYSIESVIKLVPEVSRDGISEYYRNADVFVSTSIQETFGVSCLEALASGTPVFAMKSGGVEDFINESNGRLFTIKDYISLANALKDYLEGKITFNSENIRQDIIDRYGKKVFVKKVRGIFDNILEQYGK